MTGRVLNFSETVQNREEKSQIHKETPQISEECSQGGKDGL